MPHWSHLTSCMPTKSNLYLTNSLATVWPWPVQTPYIPCTRSHVHFPLLRLYQNISPDQRHMYLSYNKASFYVWELLPPCPTLKSEDYPLSAVWYCLFNIFAATLHIGGCSSICTLSTHHAVVMGAHLSWLSLWSVAVKPHHVYHDAAKLAAAG